MFGYYIYLVHLRWVLDHHPRLFMGSTLRGKKSHPPRHLGFYCFLYILAIPFILLHIPPSPVTFLALIYIYMCVCVCVCVCVYARVCIISRHKPKNKKDFLSSSLNGV